MIILGGIVAFVLGSLLLAIPLAVAIAALLVSSFVPPVAPLIAVTGFSGISIVLLAYLVVVFLLYLFASLDTTSVVGAEAATGGVESFCRGAMIGLNASMNVFVLLALPLPGSELLALAALVVNGLALFPVASDPVYQGVLGWCAWFFPMSWLATAVGLFLMLLQIVTGFFGGGFRWFVDWPTGSFVVHGGALYVGTAYHFGNFLFFPPEWHETEPFVVPAGPGPLDIDFVDPFTVQGTIFHEGTHVFGDAALGSGFLIVGAIDQNVIPARGTGAYSELLADARTRMTDRSWIRQWTSSTTANRPATLDILSLPSSPITRGTELLLEATTSDPDGRPQARYEPGVSPAATLRWAATMHPRSGRVEIDSPTSPTATLRPLDGGLLALVCQATDGLQGDSLPPSMFNVVGADAGGPYTAVVGQPLTLVGTGSHAGTFGVPPSLLGSTPLDPTPPALAFQWAATGPGAFTLTGATSETPAFTPAVAGDYVVSLTITTTNGVTDLAVTVVSVAES